MRVAVVILNWNGKEYLKQFLPSVITHSHRIADIVVVDNGSHDDSVSFIQTNFKEVKIIRFPENLGFAQGYNDALQQLDYEYYVLLNSDVEVTPEWIEPLIELLDNDPTVAACQPKIKSYTHREKFEYAGASGGYIDKYGYPFCRGRIFNTVEEDKGQYDDSKEVFWASGACMVIRANVFNESGGFDNDFFAHMEEIDLCWRWKNMGYKIMVCPRSTVYHIGGGTLSKTNPQKTYLNFRNSITLLLKNVPAYRLMFVIASRILLDSLAGLKFAFEGHFADYVSVMKAYAYVVVHLRHTFKKRKEIIHKVRTPNITGVLQKNIVLLYYVRRKKTFSEIKAFISLSHTAGLKTSGVF
ncbi:MAG: glycosyltransferase family 2 protein [Ignavibacteriae bacterium]|nr:glycosyltransferase family 2 protein [Ignavibacteriota bacterium]